MRSEPELSFYRAVSPYTLKTTSGELAESSQRAARVLIPSSADAADVSNADLVVKDDNITNPANFSVCQACILALDGDNLVALASMHPTEPDRYSIRVWNTDVFASSKHCVEHRADHCTCYRNVQGSEYVTSCTHARGRAGFYWFVGFLCVFLLACAGYVFMRQQTCRCVQLEAVDVEQDVRAVEVRTTAALKVVGSDALSFRAAFEQELEEQKRELDELASRWQKAVRKSEKKAKERVETELAAAREAAANIDRKLAAGGQLVRASLESDLNSLKAKVADVAAKLSNA